jgi:hypothetical protein
VIKSGGPAGPAGRVIFVGAVHEAAPALAAVLASGAQTTEVVTLPAGRARTASGFVDLAPLARSRDVPVWRCTDLNAPESIEHVRRLRPDLIVVVGWTRLLCAALLAVPRHGCVGFHASLLPRYRGRAPVNWAILRGETVTGNTMMYLDAGADTGDITRVRRYGNRLLSILVNRMFGTQFTDLCYGFNAFWARHLDVLGVNCAGFEVEALMNIRAAKVGLKIQEIPSHERSRLFGASNLRAVRDGWRILKVITRERLSDLRLRRRVRGARADP